MLKRSSLFLKPNFPFLRKTNYRKLQTHSKIERQYNEPLASTFANVSFLLLFLNYFKASSRFNPISLSHTYISNSFLTDEVFFFYIITRPLPYFKTLNFTYSPKLTLNFSWLYEKCLFGLDCLNQDPNSPQITYFCIVS